MQQVPLPTQAGQEPVANPEFSRLREPGKRVRDSTGSEIELRRLTPEEKAARRRKKNIISVVVAGIILAVSLAIMLNM
jgi:hypothetical protein